MTIKVEIMREGRVVYQTYFDPLDMSEIGKEHDRIVEEVLNHATKPIHMITDTRSLKRLPTNILGQGLQSIKTVHPMGGEIVIISNNLFINKMSEMFKKMVHKYKVNVFRTPEEAWAYMDSVLAKEDAAAKQSVSMDITHEMTHR